MVRSQCMVIIGRLASRSSRFLIMLVISRGGVEDTRLEAKAKHTKKSEAKDRSAPGQGRPCATGGHTGALPPK